MDIDDGWWRCLNCRFVFHSSTVARGTIQGKFMEPPHVRVVHVIVPACPRCGATESLHPLDAKPEDC